MGYVANLTDLRQKRRSGLGYRTIVMPVTDEPDPTQQPLVRPTVPVVEDPNTFVPTDFFDMITGITEGKTPIDADGNVITMDPKGPMLPGKIIDTVTNTIRDTINTITKPARTIITETVPNIVTGKNEGIRTAIPSVIENVQNRSTFANVVDQVIKTTRPGAAIPTITTVKDRVTAKPTKPTPGTVLPTVTDSNGNTVAPNQPPETVDPTTTYNGEPLPSGTSPTPVNTADILGGGLSGNTPLMVAIAIGAALLLNQMSKK